MYKFKKIFLPVVLSVLLIIAGCSSSSEIAGKKSADPEVMKKVEANLTAFANQIQMKDGITSEIIFPMLKQYLIDNKDIYGAAFAFSPVEQDGKIIKSSPYVYKQRDNFIEKDLINSYDYTAEEQQWYVLPVKMGKPVWSDPYYDEGGGEAWMVTYSVPVYSKGNHQLIGIVTNDLFISAEK